MDRPTLKTVLLVAGVIGGVLIALSAGSVIVGTTVLFVAGVLIAVGFLGALL